MKLCYRGIPYERHTFNIPQVETGTIAQFRGATYSVSQPVLEPSAPASELTYRGVLNHETVNVRFLGRSYQYRPMLFMPVNAEA